VSGWSGALVPKRRRGVELLDDPHIDPAVRERSIVDVTHSNRWLGGLRAVRVTLRDTLRDALRGTSAAGEKMQLTLLDVGTGLADIPHGARSVARELGLELFTIGVDGAVSLLAAARSSIDAGVCADALALPFADGAVDVVICSQLLHHFVDADATRLVKELSRVARRAVVVSDLRRSWVAAAGFWLLSFPLRFHPVTRHDGTVSVMRGFTPSELRQIVRAGADVDPLVDRRLGYRLTARWTPRRAA
jgi:SAM-dependent methyltransferase